MIRTINKTYIKSPLNYVGGKYKLLPQLVPLIPDKVNAFVDLFGGGFNVGINVNASKVIYNDMIPQVVDLLNNFKQREYKTIHNSIKDVIVKYQLSKVNNLGSDLKSNYIKLRNDYNVSPDWIKFYTLLTCSFSNQIRFNSKCEFNMPYGDRYYNSSLQEKLKVFVDKLNGMDVEFNLGSFKNFDLTGLIKDDYVYCDPPYFNSLATYNEKGGWTEEDEIYLLDLLDELNINGVRFGLSNNLKYENPILDKWKDKYNVHYMNMDYSSCNYHKKDKSHDIEVFITNY